MNPILAYNMSNSGYFFGKLCSSYNINFEYSQFQKGWLAVGKSDKSDKTKFIELDSKIRLWHKVGQKSELFFGLVQ